ncbi:MAG: cupin domain-containing protein [Xanthobacteraceae bacterium]
MAAPKPKAKSAPNKTAPNKRARKSKAAARSSRAATKRRARPKAKPPARTARTKTKTRPEHAFAVSHHREGDFETGLRRYAQYRDLGMNRATGGMVQAHVIRFVPPCRPEEVSKRHYHDVDFQMVYVLRGWIKTELSGQGTHVMRAGSCWIQPPRIEHVVLDYSDDCEVLEIVLPADFETVELES